MSGVEAQEQAGQEVRVTDLARLCQEQQTEIDLLRGQVNELTSAFERLERQFNESRMRMEMPLQELPNRLV